MDSCCVWWSSARVCVDVDVDVDVDVCLYDGVSIYLSICAYRN